MVNPVSTLIVNLVIVILITSVIWMTVDWVLNLRDRRVVKK